MFQPGLVHLSAGGGGGGDGGGGGGEGGGGLNLGGGGDFLRGGGGERRLGGGRRLHERCNINYFQRLAVKFLSEHVFKQIPIKGTIFNANYENATTYMRRGGGGDLRFGFHTYLLLSVFRGELGMKPIVLLSSTDFNFLATPERVSSRSFPTASVPAATRTTKKMTDLSILNASNVIDQFHEIGKKVTINDTIRV
jgi:hypothetical protein